MTARATTLRLVIDLLGVIVLAVHLLLALLSYPQAAALWHATEFPRAGAFFQWLGSPSEAFAAFAHALDSRQAVMLSHMVALAVASVAAAILLILLSRQEEPSDADAPRRLRRWSLAFAAVSIPAYPVFTQDFWLSAAWGRMVAAGINPFHTLFTDNTLTGLPLDHFPMAMSYGPLWAVVSGAVALIAFDNALIMGVLFKLLIAAAWIAALLILDGIHRDSPARERCLAIALFGWVPLGVMQSIAEGHNDIVMIAAALLWFALLKRRSAAAPQALAASVLCKYVTAPLFLIDLIHAFRHERLTVLQYAWRMLPALLLGLAFLALFFRSMSFFDGLWLIGGWYFLRPSEVVSGIEQLLGVGLVPLHAAALAVFPVAAVYWLAAAIRDGREETLLRATVALVAAILFGIVSHLWPWYLVWGIGFAALQPQWWVSRFITGVALLIPFSLATWWIDRLEPLRDVVALAIYAGAGLWLLFTRQRPGVANR
ncbi:MAG: hypothetical protein IT536_15930 [Hyphomicrobiales bacterium]|nr:hypothetical protein [Hyphomicrobiales bacterium]